MGFDLDDLSSGNLVSGAVTDGLLVLLDGRAVDNGTGSNTNVVVLGEDPSVEIRGDVVTDVHLSHLFVEGHLLIRDLDALLEGDGEVVLSSVHGLGDTGVGSIGTDDQINFHGSGNTGGRSFLEFGVADLVLGVLVGLVVGWNIDVGDKCLDALGSVLDGTVTKELVHNFTTAHTNVLVGLQSGTNVDFDTGGGDKIHSANLTINDSLGDVEFTNHTKRDGSSAWLGVVKLTLEQDGVDCLFLGEDLSSASSRRSSTNDSDLVLHVQLRCGLGSLGDGSLSHESRVGEGIGNGGEASNSDKSELHFLGLMKRRRSIKEI
mmetsp:Transcript_35186/g.85237  ORF Transcript_35186/g.85237 Transcript_35186/m.85237 type:complete len:319 (+) Transcript_35186:571-1527(+)